VVFQALASSSNLNSDEVKTTKYIKAIYNKQKQEILCFQNTINKKLKLKKTLEELELEEVIK